MTFKKTPDPASVKRTFVSFPISDFKKIKQQLLNWASRFNSCCFLDSQSYPGTAQSKAKPLGCILAAGILESVQANAGNAFEQLEEFTSKRSRDGQKDWLFGHFGYGLARETEPIHAAQSDGPTLPDRIGFPDLFFFIPEIVIELEQDGIRIGSLKEDQEVIYEQIRHISLPDSGSYTLPSIPPFQAGFSREEYLQTIQKLRDHILRGDCYEINFCQEFFSQPARIDPLQVWQRLSEASPNPFSAFYKLDKKYLLCASPERYLRREGNTLISQPIKGTSPRHPEDAPADKTAREWLFNSPKDRSENVMVVDLVRNDLSKICREGSVRVEELFGIYSFPQVHQMISTIKGELLQDTDLVDCIRATFPMGSMTGAPKNRVVELIGRYEKTSRGLFSGAVGYVTPDGDFDFNVVIRSIFYNGAGNYLSYQVGSGITFHSDPVAEYEECMLKAEGIKKALDPGFSF
ncbi:anthranilate synthase component I family protein [Flavitalea flava]